LSSAGRFAARASWNALRSAIASIGAGRGPDSSEISFPPAGFPAGAAPLAGAGPSGRLGIVAFVVIVFREFLIGRDRFSIARIDGVPKEHRAAVRIISAPWGRVFPERNSSHLPNSHQASTRI
jgi:hypothetical protein